MMESVCILGSMMGGGRGKANFYVFVCNLLYLLNELLCAEKQITERLPN